MAVLAPTSMSGETPTSLVVAGVVEAVSMPRRTALLWIRRVTISPLMGRNLLLL